MSRTKEKTIFLVEVEQNDTFVLYEPVSGYIRRVNSTRERRKIVMLDTLGVKTIKKKQALPSADAMNRKFRCRFLGCDWTFDTMSKLRRHTISHENDGAFHCQLCKTSFKHIYNVFQHWRESCKKMKHLHLRMELKGMEPSDLRCQVAALMDTQGRLEEFNVYNGVFWMPKDPDIMTPAYATPCHICHQNIPMTLYEEHIAVHRGYLKIDETETSRYTCHLCLISFQYQDMLYFHWRHDCGEVNAYRHKDEEYSDNHLATLAFYTLQQAVSRATLYSMSRLEYNRSLVMKHNLAEQTGLDPEAIKKYSKAMRPYRDDNKFTPFMGAEKIDEEKSHFQPSAFSRFPLVNMLAVACPSFYCNRQEWYVFRDPEDSTVIAQVLVYHNDRSIIDEYAHDTFTLPKFRANQNFDMWEIGNNELSCKKCNLTFSNRARYEIHKKIVHEINDGYCTLCAEKAGSLYDLIIHWRRHCKFMLNMLTYNERAIPNDFMICNIVQSIIMTNLSPFDSKMLEQLTNIKRLQNLVQPIEKKTTSLEAYRNAKTIYHFLQIPNENRSNINCAFCFLPMHPQLMPSHLISTHNFPADREYRLMNYLPATYDRPPEVQRQYLLNFKNGGTQEIDAQEATAVYKKQTPTKPIAKQAQPTPKNVEKSQPKLPDVSKIQSTPTNVKTSQSTPINVEKSNEKDVTIIDVVTVTPPQQPATNKTTFATSTPINPTSRRALFSPESDIPRRKPLVPLDVTYNINLKRPDFLENATPTKRIDFDSHHLFFGKGAAQLGQTAEPISTPKKSAAEQLAEFKSSKEARLRTNVQGFNLTFGGFPVVNRHEERARLRKQRDEQRCAYLNRRLFRTPYTKDLNEYRRIVYRATPLPRIVGTFPLQQKSQSLSQTILENREEYAYTMDVNTSGIQPGTIYKHIPQLNVSDPHKALTEIASSCGVQTASTKSRFYDLEVPQVIIVPKIVDKETPRPKGIQKVLKRIQLTKAKNAKRKKNELFVKMRNGLRMKRSDFEELKHKKLSRALREMLRTESESEEDTEDEDGVPRPQYTIIPLNGEKEREKIASITGMQIVEHDEREILPSQKVYAKILPGKSYERLRSYVGRLQFSQIPHMGHMGCDYTFTKDGNLVIAGWFLAEDDHNDYGTSMVSDDESIIEIGEVCRFRYENNWFHVVCVPLISVDGRPRKMLWPAELTYAYDKLGRELHYINPRPGFVDFRDDRSLCFQLDEHYIN